MRGNFRHLFQEKLIVHSSIVFLAVVALYSVLGVWKWQTLPPELPLFYSLPRGNEQLATPWQLLWLPGLSAGIFLANLLAASFFYTKERLAAILLVVTGTLISITLLIAFVKIIFLIS